MGWGDRSNQVLSDPKSSRLSKLLFIDLSFVTEAYCAKQKGFLLLLLFRKCRSDARPCS